MSVNISALLDVVSLSLLTAEVPSSICWLITGLIGFVGNATLLVVVLRNSALRTGFYCSALHLFLSDALYCLMAVIVAVKRLAHNAMQYPETASPAFCAGFLIPIYLFKASLPGRIQQ